MSASVLAAQSNVDILTKIDHVLIVAIIAVTIAIVAVTAIVVTNVRISRERRVSAGMIQEMLAHNLSADEIERIMLVWAANSEDVSKILRRQRKEQVATMKLAKKQIDKAPPQRKLEKATV